MKKEQFELEHYQLIIDIRGKITECEGKHIQQVVYSTYHDALTQVCFGCKKIRTTIPAGTTINLEPVEEVKVKSFVPKDIEEYWFITEDLEIDYDVYHAYVNKIQGIIGLQFRTKEDAQIAQKKVIKLFNSFK